MSAEAKPNRVIDRIGQPLEVSSEVTRHLVDTLRRLPGVRIEKLPKELGDRSTPQIHYHDSVDQV